jgi:hypothetical protein
MTTPSQFIQLASRYVAGLDVLAAPITKKAYLTAAGSILVTEATLKGHVGTQPERFQ